MVDINCRLKVVLEMTQLFLCNNISISISDLQGNVEQEKVD